MICLPGKSGWTLATRTLSNVEVALETKAPQNVARARVQQDHSVVVESAQRERAVAVQSFVEQQPEV